MSLTLTTPFSHNQCSICQKSSGRVERRRRENRGTEDAEGRGVGRGVLSPPREWFWEGLCPLRREIYIIFQHSAFWCILYTNSRVTFAIKCRER